MWREGRFRVWKPKHNCECDHPLEVAHPRFGKCLVEGCGCAKYKQKNRPNKLHARKQEFNGRRYDSGLEARVAADLEYQRVAGDIQEIIPQFPIDFVINGIKICRHYVDFMVIYKDGTKELVEAKGVWTEVARMKRRLVEAVYLKNNPMVKYRVERC